MREEFHVFHAVVVLRPPSLTSFCNQNVGAPAVVEKMSLSRQIEYQNHPGSIVLILGPMFAGKTTELMRRVKRELFAQRRCAIVKYAKDNRYSDNTQLATHDKNMISATFAFSQLSEFGERWRDYDVVAIDEGQFFPDVATFSKEAADHGVKVIISALDGDFQRRPFGKIPELIPLCDTLIKVTAVCMMCQCREAPFTKRIVAGNQQELIGGAEMYAATCRRCYLDPEPPTPGRMRRYNAAREAAESGNLGTAAAAKAGLVDLTPSPKKHRNEASA